MKLILLVLNGLIILFFLYSCVLSLFEKENRAAFMLLATGMVLLVPPSLMYYYSANLPQDLLLAIPIIYILAAIVFFFPFQIRIKKEVSRPAPGYDERNIMFSRKLFEPGTERFEEYYKEFPEHRKPDDHFRQKPGLLDEKSRYYHPFLFNAANSNFDTVKAFYPLVDGPANQEKHAVDPEELSAFLKQWAKRSGACDLGITLLEDYHKYSVTGRGKNFGKAIELNHKYAIALTVEMDKSLIDTAPEAPVTYETSYCYLDSGKIAVQLAVFLRKLGYEARAHIDGNYQVICPLVARDAGLGNIGRMGLLMTPRQGPRVRIAVVTTNAPLKTSKRNIDKSIPEFCKVCKKCADCCPSKAIPFEDKTIINGVRRWQINQEKCYTYWCIAGTDCGRCIAVCPYSHPDNLFHNIIRFGIRYNPLFRKIAARMDDIYYGKKPKIKKDPLGRVL